MKPIITKQRKRIIDKLQATGGSVFLSYDDGAKHYAMTDGTKANERVIKGMIDVGLLIPAGQSFSGMESQQYVLGEQNV